MIAIPEGPAAAGTLATPVGNEIVNATPTEDVAAQLDDRVTDVRVANGADGDFLFRSLANDFSSYIVRHPLTRQFASPPEPPAAELVDFFRMSSCLVASSSLTLVFSASSSVSRFAFFASRISRSLPAMRVL